MLVWAEALPRVDLPPEGEMPGRAEGGMLNIDLQYQKAFVS